MTWATSVPILVFLCLSVLDLGPMYVTDRQTSYVRCASSLNAAAFYGRGIKVEIEKEMKTGNYNVMFRIAFAQPRYCSNICSL